MMLIEVIGWFAIAYIVVQSAVNLLAWGFGWDLRTDENEDTHWKGRFESASEKIEAVKHQYNLSDDDVEAAVDSYRDYQSDDEAIPYEKRN